MTLEYAIRLAQKWAFGGVCSLREGEAQEYHKMALAALEAQRNGAVPVLHGYWLPPVVGSLGALCSECETQSDNPYNYCPNCGAKMDLE